MHPPKTRPGTSSHTYTPVSSHVCPLIPLTQVDAFPASHLQPPPTSAFFPSSMYAPNSKKPRLRAGLARPVRPNPKTIPTPLREGVDVPPPTQPARPPLRPVPPKQLRPPGPAARPVAPAARPPASAAPAARASSASAPPPPKEYFSVLYTKRSKKKHKSWQDGYLILTNDRHVQLFDDEGKSKTTARFPKALGGLRNGNTLEISSYELEVQDPVSEEDYVSGRVFVPPAPTPRAAQPVAPRKPQRLLKRPPGKSSIAPATKRDSETKRAAPAHDPNAQGAVMLLPSIQISGKPTSPIVLDPFLGKRMRPHQRTGVRFLFDCTAGKRIRDGDGPEGAILADDMGLGKSLQAIALIWTLLKQGPSGAPLARKAIIVCPASLVRNWQNEVRKWLGDERLRPVAMESGSSSYESKAEMAAFLTGSVRRLLIISYEMFRTQAQDLYSCGCGLVVCDEGHRLKSVGGNKTVDALRGLPCRRRVILTGTPVQNDLEEFFAVCDFVNPACLNSLSSFRAVFAAPILASRDTRASQTTKEVGEARAKQLGRIASAFVLRRTSAILEKYLPPKQETAVFCRLSKKQEEAYEDEAARCSRCLFGSNMSHAPLSAIMQLRKICGHPSLLKREQSGGVPSDRDDDFESRVQGGEEEKGEPEPADSVKMVVTLSICQTSIAAGDRIVLVSNFTSSLDLLQTALKSSSITFCRLDGSTAVSGRGDIVRRFNEGTIGDVFLLSAKAGGVGLNLIGANRLILFDPDWNPATDAQAMARVWRDGQKKDVFVYRLLCTGTIEEKIFQRQLFKRELHYAVDGDEQGRDGLNEGQDGNFDKDELKDIFRYNADLKFCETLNVLQRSHTDWDGEEAVPRSRLLLEQFLAFKRTVERQGNVKHYVWCDGDDILEQALNADPRTHGLVSYLFTKKSSGDDESIGKSNQCEEPSKRKVPDTAAEKLAPKRPRHEEPDCSPDEVLTDLGEAQSCAEKALDPKRARHGKPDCSPDEVHQGKIEEKGEGENVEFITETADEAVVGNTGETSAETSAATGWPKTWDDVVDDLDDL